MEPPKIVNLVDSPSDEYQKFATRKWYVINDQNNGKYGEGNEYDSTIKFETKDIKPNLCDYSNAYILVTGDITLGGGTNVATAAFKNCAPFTRCVLHINDEHLNCRKFRHNNAYVQFTRIF